MRSLIVLEVEHGEDTDALQAILHKVNDPVHQAVYDYRVVDTTARVDVPASMVLDLDIPSVVALHKMNASTPPKG